VTNAGRNDRLSRVTEHRSGAWGTVSQDLLHLAAKLFRLSKDESNSQLDKNTSRFVYAGIPLLLAAVHSFAVEYEGILNLEPLPAELSTDPLAKLMETRYGLSGRPLEDLRDLIEIRNEIIHPHPMPTGTPDNWPDYLRHIKQKEFLSSTGDPKTDYIMLAQIASHRLFGWAVEVTKGLYGAIVNSNPTKAQLFQNFLDKNFKTLFG
jgi:hypothetical protein